MKISTYTGTDIRNPRGRAQSEESQQLRQAMAQSLTTGKPVELAELSEIERKTFANRLRAFAAQDKVSLSIGMNGAGNMVITVKPQIVKADTPVEIVPEPVVETPKVTPKAVPKAPRKAAVKVAASK